MSTFIVKADYGNAIKTNILDDITELNDSLLDECETQAVALMTGYLNARYDTAAIFSATGSDRHPVILMYAIDIALYNLHRRVAWRKTPTFRTERYNEAREWLQKVNAMEINDPTLPKVADDITRDYVRFGSNPKRSNGLADPVSDEDVVE